MHQIFTLKKPLPETRVPGQPAKTNVRNAHVEMALKWILIDNSSEDKTMANKNMIDLKSDLHCLIDRVNDTTLLNVIKAILNAHLKENDL